MDTFNLSQMVDDQHERLMREDADYRTECLYNDIAAQILDQMEDRGMTQADLAEKMGVSEARVSKLLRNTSNISLKTLAKVAIALELSIDFELGRATAPLWPPKEEALDQRRKQQTKERDKKASSQTEEDGNWKPSEGIEENREIDAFSAAA